MFHAIASLRDFGRSLVLGLFSALIISGAIAQLPLRSPATPVIQAAATQLVDIQTINAHIRLDLRYATTNNFTHHKLYNQARCLLRPTAAARLSRVQRDLEHQGFGLKVYDCYRPLSVQRAMWTLVQNENYVANPAKGSRHNRGSAVDVTLVDRAGRELPMPSGFDEFSERAHLAYQGGSAQALRDRQRLQTAMTNQGFLALPTEWWHFDDPAWANYPLLDIPLDAIKN